MTETHPRRLLHAEDYPSMQELVAEIGETFGWSVQAFANLTSAMSAVENQSWDGAIVDGRLEDDKLTEKLILATKAANIPTLVMSGSTHGKAKEWADNTGAQYLNKAEDTPILMRTLINFLR